MGRLGFANRSAGLAPAERTPHEDQLVGSDGACADLHRTPVGVRADEDTLWSALATHREPMLLYGTQVQVLDERPGACGPPGVPASCSTTPRVAGSSATPSTCERADAIAAAEQLRREVRRDDSRDRGRGHGGGRRDGRGLAVG